MMDRSEKRVILRHSFFLLTGVLLLGLALVLGTSYARYQATVNTNFTLKGTFTASPVHFYQQTEDTDDDTGRTAGEKYQPIGKWEKVEGADNSYELKFRMSNALDARTHASQTLEVTLLVLETIPDNENGTLTVAADQKKPTVQLEANGQTYEGKAESVTQGSVFWKKYGEGTVYRFYNTAGEQISFTLPGGRESEIPMTLTVTDGVTGVSYALITDRIDQK